MSNDNDNEESIVTSKERDNYCYDIPNAKQDPRDLTAFKYSSIESETNTSMGTMNGGDGSPCFHKSRQFPTNTKIEFHQAVICDLFPLVARGLVKEESNVGGAGVLDRGSVRPRDLVPPSRTPRKGTGKKERGKSKIEPDQAPFLVVVCCNCDCHCV